MYNADGGQNHGPSVKISMTQAHSELEHRHFEIMEKGYAVYYKGYRWSYCEE